MPGVEFHTVVNDLFRGISSPMIGRVRIVDIPVFVMTLVISMILFSGFIALWKATNGMPDALAYFLMFAIFVGSFMAANFIWKRIRK